MSWLLFNTTSISFSLPFSPAWDEKISPPEASESISRPRRDLVIFGSCRICSRSSPNASATDAIQNCLNRFRRACSSWARLLDPSGGRNGGTSAGGGEGEGDRGRAVAVASSGSLCRDFAEEIGAAAGSPMTWGASSSFSESDDEGEDEDRDGDDDSAKDAGACFFRGALLTGVFLDTSSEEESEESDDDEDDARRRLRFLLRLRGAVGLAVGIL